MERHKNLHCTDQTRRYLATLAVLIGAMLSIFALVVLASHQWDANTFVFHTPLGVDVQRGWGVGYDGRFSYALAVNPFGSQVGLDQPNYRYQRYLYPLLVRIFSAGQTELVPWVMLILNLISALVAGTILGCLLIRRGTVPWYALIFIFSVGFLLTIRMDLLEPLTFALALGGWLSYEKDRPGLAALLWALSGLTKEVGLLFPVAIMIWELMQKKWQRAWLPVLSLLPYVTWYVVLLVWMGTSDTAIAQSSLMLIPFSGFQFLKDPTSRIVVLIWVLLPAVIFGLLVFWDNLRDILSFALDADSILVLVQVALIATMPQLTWQDPLAVLRVGLGFLAALLLWLASHRPRLLPYAAALWGPTGLMLVIMPGMLW